MIILYLFSITVNFKLLPFTSPKVSVKILKTNMHNIEETMNNKQLFISFSSKNSDEAKRVCALLEQNNYPCFISSRDLIAGKEYAGQLIDNIADSKAVILLLSEDSNNSPHVLREVEYAVSKNIPIIVYALEEVKLSKSMEYYLMTHQWIPADSNKDERLLDGVSNILNGNAAPFAPVNNTANAIPAYSGPDKSTGKSKAELKFIIAILVIILLALSVRIIAISLFNNKKETSNTTNDDVASVTFTPTPLVSEPATKVPNPTEEPVATKAPSSDVEIDYKLGDTVTFGKYNGAEIEWRVIKINNDGTMVMISKDILSMKIFDSAEGGEYNMYEGVNYYSYSNHIIEDPTTCIMARGNNDWSISNLRTWLNSDAELVEYKDHKPDRKAYMYNYYDGEAGFLHSFTQEEKAAIIPVNNVTIGNSLSNNGKGGPVESFDLVYLLSSDDLHLLADAGISNYAYPSQTCIENDNNPEGYAYINKEFGTKSFYWWLRDNPEKYPNQVYCVASELESDKKTIEASAGANTYGVRPVVTVNAASFKK